MLESYINSIWKFMSVLKDCEYCSKIYFEVIVYINELEGLSISNEARNSTYEL